MSGHPVPAPRRRRRLILAATVLAVVAAATIGRVAWSALHGSFDLLGVAGFLVSSAALAGDLVALARQETDRAVAPVGALADELSTVLREEWYAEARARRLRDARILPLRWGESQRGVGDSVRSVTGGDLDGRLRLDGELKDNFDDAVRQLGDAYAQVHSGRLVVLGQPGSGKSALALMLAYGLVTGRADGAALPVLLSASSWDPLTESLDEWMVQSLAAAYYSGRAEVPRRLLEQDLLVPIVDGIDEIPESSRRSAIRAVNEATAGRRPVVVTCRSVEYHDLIEGGAPVLRRAAVVEVRQVTATELVRYLRSLEWPAGVEWDQVAAHVTANPRAPVTEALSTPLMISLARTVYQRLGGDPARLLADFPSRHAVEDHLTDRAIDAAYAPGPDPARRRAGGVDAAEARRRLTFLAQYLHRHGERDLVWWRLSQRLVSPWVAAALGIVGGVLVMVAAAMWVAFLDGPDQVPLDASLVFAAAVGGSFAVLVMIIWFSAGSRPPGRLSLSAAGSLGRLRPGFRAGVGVVAIPGVTVLVGVAAIITLSGLWSLLNVELFLEGAAALLVLSGVVGAALAAHGWLDSPSGRAAQASPLGFLRQDRRSSLVGAAVAGGMVGVLALPGVVLGVTAGSLASKTVSRWAGYPGPRRLDLLARARIADVTVLPFGDAALVIGATVVLPAVAVAVLVLLTRAWPRFAIVRLVLRARGQLPWDVIGFLTDARDRELVRQSAGTFQFRHIRLQERLANQVLDTTRHPPRDPALLLTRRRGRRAALAAVTVVVALAALLVGRIPDDSSEAVFVGAYQRGPYESWTDPTLGLVATGSRWDGTVRVWDLRSGDLRAALDGHSGLVEDVRFGRGGRVAVVRTRVLGSQVDHEVVSLWDLRSGSLLSRKDGAAYVVAGGDRIVLSATTDRPRTGEEAQVWDAVEGRLLRRIPGIVREDPADDDEGGSGPAPTSFVAVRGNTGDVVLWDAVRAGPVRSVPRVGADTAFGVSTDGRSFFVDGVGVWDTATGRPLPVPVQLGRTVFAETGARVATTSGGRPNSDGDDDTIRLWARSGGRPLLTHVQAGGFLRIQFFSAGTRLVVVTGSDTRKDVSVWDAATGARVATVTDVVGSAFRESGAGLLLLCQRAGDAPDTVRVWNLRTGRQQASLPGMIRSDYDPRSPGVSPDGRWIVIEAASGERHLYDARTGERRMILAARSYGGESAFTADSATLVDEASGEVGIWDLPTGTRRVTVPLAPVRVALGQLRGDGGLEPATRSVVQVAPDGRTVVTVSPLSEQALVWDLRSGRLLRTLTGHSGPIRRAAYTSDGRLILTGGWLDSSVRLWDVPD